MAIPAFGTIEQFDKVCEHLGEERGGQVARYAETAEDGKLRVVSRWESKAHADRFFADMLDPARDKALRSYVGAPEVVGIDIARSYVREPVAEGMHD